MQTVRNAKTPDDVVVDLTSNKAGSCLGRNILGAAFLGQYFTTNSINL